MNKWFFLVGLLWTMIGCCSSIERQIQGKWKMSDMEYTNPSDTTNGVAKSYYEMKLKDKIIEFKADSVKWNEGWKFHFCKINEETKQIELPGENIEIVSLKDGKLVLKERVEGAVLLMTFNRQ